MVAILNNKMAYTDRDYSSFYNSFFSLIAEDRPSILFVYCRGFIKFVSRWWKVKVGGGALRPGMGH